MMMTSNTKNTTTTAAAAMKPPAEQELRCPRCDSSNTKFCYYNNYSLSQPRHFCKTCRRYWTKGGVLRSVPVGGGCHKSKKSATAALSSSTSSWAAQLVNFNLGIVPSTQFVGFNYPIAATGLDEQMFGFHHGGGVSSTNNNIAYYIESLSSINQDLHWKLQQQRLAMMFGDAAQNKIEINHVNQIEPISFHVGEGSSRGEIFGDKLMGTAQSHDAVASATTWFFDSTSANYNNGRINGSNTNNSSSSSSSNNNNNASDWNGVENWSDMPQFSTLPKESEGF